MSGEVTVRMAHIRQADICSSGARSFWKHHNLDWNRFLSEGTSAESLLATGDAQAARVVEIARGQGR